MPEKSWFAKNVIDLHAGEEEKTTPQPGPVEHRKSFIGNTDQVTPVQQPSSNAWDMAQPGVNPADLEKARAQIAGMLKGANLPGIDYYEFSTAKLKLNMIPDEATKFTTAFDMLSSMGLTKAILLSSADTYMKRLDDEMNGLKQASAQMQKTDVDDKLALIAEKQAQLNQLTTDITALNDQVNKAKAIINSRSSAFIQAATEQKTQIQSEKDKINQYIQ